MVTGANSGLGLAIARELSIAGATVIVACRNMAKAEKAAEEIRSAGSLGPIEVLPLDLADLASVSQAAETFRASKRPLHLMINNAGLMAVDKSQTVDGFETQFGVNHLGHFALTADLLPVLESTPGSRIVNMSSMGHRMGRLSFDDLMHERNYNRWTSYFQSKLANLLFTAELQRRLAAAGATTSALTAHPGASNTNLYMQGGALSNKAMKLVPYLAQSATQGAEPALRAATDPTAVGGQFYGPRWIVRGHAVVETPSKRARNADDAKRLWAVSEELIGQKVLS